MVASSAIGEAIRLARKGMGLRQDELAAAAGVGLRFLVELERGKPTVQLGKVLLVLAAVGLDVQVIPRQASPDKATPS
jgi:y4mF family transcriptional regulator